MQAARANGERSDVTVAARAGGCPTVAGLAISGRRAFAFSLLPLRDRRSRTRAEGGYPRCSVSNRSRHLFVQRAQGERLFERDLRAEHDEPEHGFVASAQYFEHHFALGHDLRGWFERLKDWFRDAPHAAVSDTGKVRLLPPFDPQRKDVFGYFAGELPPLLDGVDDPIHSVRLGRGTIVPLHPRSRGDDVVLRDYWATDAPAWRLTDMLDFGLQTDRRAPIAVCCAQCPLVIADPETGVFDQELSQLDPRAAEQCELDKIAWRGRAVTKCTLREGDVIDVLGVVWDPDRCRSRFDVLGRGGPFRSAGVEPVRFVLGDERGTRMVIRKVSA